MHQQHNSDHLQWPYSLFHYIRVWECRWFHSKCDSFLCCATVQFHLRVVANGRRIWFWGICFSPVHSSSLVLSAYGHRGLLHHVVAPFVTPNSLQDPRDGPRYGGEEERIHFSSSPLSFLSFSVSVPLWTPMPATLKVANLLSVGINVAQPSWGITPPQ